MKIKLKVIIISIFVIYIGGFVSGRVMKPFRPKDIIKTEKILDRETLQENYKKRSQSYIDSANSEMFNFSVRYYHLPIGMLPGYYVSHDGKMTQYNKENFFYYYSMYKITDYLSKSKSSIIEDLLLEQKKDTI